jgi:hypothetical protein
VYEIDQETRDRLIAHARQDAAHAVPNTVAIMQDVLALKADLRNFVRSIVVGLVGCFALLAAARLVLTRLTVRASWGAKEKFSPQAIEQGRRAVAPGWRGAP